MILLTPMTVREVLDLAKEIKGLLKSGDKTYKPFTGQTLSMIFTKPSTRTRVSFESGFFRLGGHALCLGEEVGIGKREATKDVARVLAGMNEMLVRRTACIRMIRRRSRDCVGTCIVLRHNWLLRSVGTPQSLSWSRSPPTAPSSLPATLL
eukprot:6160831-Pleurochrysis_carterae.AAC.1